MHIKRNDTVMVVAGNHKGEKGRVKKILKKKNRVIVAGVNIRKKHVKPSQENPQGGRIDVEGSISMSNVQPLNEKTGKPGRVKVQKLEDGKKVRVFKDNTEFGERY